MQHYESKIDKALDFILSPGLLHATGDRPVCYLTYDVRDAFDVSRMIDADILAKSVHAGFDMKVVSMKDIITDYITNHEYYEDAWTLEDGISEEEIFESIRTEIQESNFIADAILAKQEEVKGHGKPLLVFTDLEWLHPFDKMGRIEQVIYKKIEVPMLILYPGSSQGIARTFLNIYPMDGNYRSKNF